jgi:hypothetical protein
LVHAPGGIEIAATCDQVAVVTKYEPVICGWGKTLFEAVRDAAVKILKECETTPAHKESCPDVLAALEHYDTHSRMPQSRPAEAKP